MLVVCVWWRLLGQAFHCSVVLIRSKIWSSSYWCRTVWFILNTEARLNSSRHCLNSCMHQGDEANWINAQYPTLVISASLACIMPIHCIHHPAMVMLFQVALTLVGKLDAYLKFCRCRVVLENDPVWLDHAFCLPYHRRGVCVYVLFI